MLIKCHAVRNGHVSTLTDNCIEQGSLIRHVNFTVDNLDNWVDDKDGTWTMIILMI